MNTQNGQNWVRFWGMKPMSVYWILTDTTEVAGGYRSRREGGLIPGSTGPWSLDELGNLPKPSLHLPGKFLRVKVHERIHVKLLEQWPLSSNTQCKHKMLLLVSQDLWMSVLSVFHRAAFPRLYRHRNTCELPITPRIYIPIHTHSHIPRAFRNESGCCHKE